MSTLVILISLGYPGLVIERFNGMTDCEAFKAKILEKARESGYGDSRKLLHCIPHSTTPPAPAARPSRMS